MSTCLSIAEGWRQEVARLNMDENRSKADFAVVGATQTRTRMNLEIQQRGLPGQVLSRPKVLGTRIESKRCFSKAEAEEKDRFHHAAGHAIVSLPGGCKQKAQWVKGAAVPVAAVPVMSRLPTLKDMHKAQSSITAALTSAGHGQGGPLYTIFAGHTASLKFMVGAKTSQVLLALYNDHDVRHAWNTNPKKTSGPIQLLRPWMKRHQWMETAQWTWWHPAAQWCLGPRNAVFHAERQGSLWKQSRRVGSCSSRCLESLVLGSMAEKDCAI